MSSSARVSVVIPVHDAAPYVEMAVRSALGSDLAEIEVIAVNDGSTDRSGDILASISDPRLLTVQLQASGGPSRPRNVGIARSRRALHSLPGRGRPDQARPALRSGKRSRSAPRGRFYLYRL